jgi:aminomethyltransferase
MNDKGGVVDDTIITSFEDHISMVVNAGCKDKDLSYLLSSLPSSISLEYLEDWGLLALQGPSSSKVLQTLLPEDLSKLKFMNAYYGKISKINAKVLITRCGYTGEDGFEITVEPSKTVALAELLLSQDEVKPIGLGARDSLRLEAGLCLYGHDLNEDLTPVEAGLIWTIPKHRRETGGFVGDSVVLSQIKSGPAKSRVGFTMKEGSSAREGAVIVKDGREIGNVCSGGFSPTLKHPIGMAYVEKGFGAIGTEHDVVFRGKNVKIEISKMPFVPTRYFK